MAAVDVGEVAEITGESREFVLNRGLESYLEEELRDARIRIKEIREEYGVEEREELELKIEKNIIEEHPAWEDLIEWENLEERREKIRQLLKDIQN